jgi:hypothetical protein
MEAQFHKCKDPPTQPHPKKSYNHLHKNDMVLVCIHISKSKNHPRYIYEGFVEMQREGGQKKAATWKMMQKVAKQLPRTNAVVILLLLSSHGSTRF